MVPGNEGAAASAAAAAAASGSSASAVAAAAAAAGGSNSAAASAAAAAASSGAHMAPNHCCKTLPCHEPFSLHLGRSFCLLLGLQNPHSVMKLANSASLGMLRLLQAEMVPITAASWLHVMSRSPSK